MPNWFNTNKTTGIRELDDRTTGLERLKKKVKTLQHVQEVSVLDIGCAEGLISNWLISESGIVFGVDSDLDKIISAREIYTKKSYKFVQGDAGLLDEVCTTHHAEEQYDIVLLLAILQKLEDPLTCFRAALNKAKSFIAVRVPDYWYNEYWTKEIQQEYQDQNWELCYHIPQLPNDDKFQGHLIVLQKKTTVETLAEIRRDLKETSKAVFIDNSNFTIVSFPKSGRTWIRYFLATWLDLEYKGGFDLEFMPQTYWTAERKSVDFPHIHFTHDFFDLHQEDNITPVVSYQQIYDHKPILLLLRNPFDTIVSYYYHKTKREHTVDLNLEQFILDDRYGIGRYCDWMSTMLDYALSKSDSMIITYEDMSVNMEQQMRTMFKFMKISDPNNNIHQATLISDFETMRNAEIKASSEQNTTGIGRLAMPGWDGDTQKLKVRKGQVNAWQDDINSELLTAILADPRVTNYLRKLQKFYPASSPIW